MSACRQIIFVQGHFRLFRVDKNAKFNPKTRETLHSKYFTSVSGDFSILLYFYLCHTYCCSSSSFLFALYLVSFQTVSIWIILETDYSCCGLRNRLGFPGEGILILCRSFNYGKGEPSFHLFGFIMCVGATAARALKSVLQGILLFSKGEKLNSMNLLLYMAPIAVVFLLPATLSMEENVVGITLALARDNSRIIWLLLFNSAVAYFVNLTNFMVTKHR
ncbi:probable sugar phosphate/phosphate translocator At5g11230 isoform X7 [Lycium barbarum]|uniref:probable sugar phosphate/phosphate translocator At5g11230 isoform X7 n=1 Tax=Lycium barbarum TaxID=112863 RepID=UPI00293F63A3|nr:probable sugar phosphate/phosphate translocator At5g11230 isoform X7 [Lycium barbarum]